MKLPEKIQPKFPYQKKSHIHEFLTPKNPLHLPITFNPEQPLPTPLGPTKLEKF